MNQTLLKLSTILMLTLGTAMGADMPGAAGGDETKAMSQAWIKAQLVLPSGEVSSTIIDCLLYNPNCIKVKLGRVNTIKKKKDMLKCSYESIE